MAPGSGKMVIVWPIKLVLGGRMGITCKGFGYHFKKYFSFRRGEDSFSTDACAYGSGQIGWIYSYKLY